MSRDISNVAEHVFSTFRDEYLRENETDSKKKSGRESGAQGGLIDEKNQRSIFSCHCPFKNMLYFLNSIRSAMGDKNIIVIFLNLSKQFLHTK